MSAKLKFSRNPYGLTTLELRGRDFDLELKLVSRLGKKERRTIVRGFLRQIKPWLFHLREGAIDHPDCAIIRSSRARRRGISIDQGLPFDDPRAKLGYEIRMKRLRMGLTQSELAAQLDISRPHLSAIERGHFTPRAKTWSAVTLFLSEIAPSFDE
jgi:DNA-binding XRE family transcriptional regulator